MKLQKFDELCKEFIFCPQCGSQMIGNGSGSLNVDEDTFQRGCKCGWSVVVTVKADGTEERIENLSN